ncbi:MAG: hypothetical protein JSS66_18070 [Armatimonadetes bacterium]|nr:hypothetical protein [Armatimonadota bacterium]
MSFRVNNNVVAMSAYRNLSATGDEIAKSITRLSTGLRINSGADDPAGLIASENFRRQISGMDAALRNNQDALNYAKTADGALEEVSKLLRDARALAVANGNSTVDANQKLANQNQLNNIMTSISRIAQSTSFGDKKLLDGSAGTYGTVNDPANVASVNLSGTMNTVSMTTNGTLDITMTQAAAQAQLAGGATYAGATSAVATGVFTLNGYAFNVGGGETVADVVSKINSSAATTGVQAQFNGTTGTIDLSSNAYGSDKLIHLTDGNGLILASGGSASAAGADAQATVAYMNGATTLATAAFTRGHGLQLRDADNNVINLTTTGASNVSTYTGAIQVTAGQSSFQIGANADQTALLTLSSFNASALGLGNLDITVSDMTTPLNAIDAAISTVSTTRGNIGSFMRNTIESNMRSLNVTKENLTSTESTIRDIDVAEEMTSYTKLQILQQSGLAVLAQANQSPQAVLNLLRG